jgi:hypothetical protein
VARMPEAKAEVSHLLLRKLAAERGEDPMAVPCGFDDVDILAVDYDLLHLDDAGGRTTGEGVARLARTFSKCGVIVVMNQYKGPQFDLGMRGHLDSLADVNVDANLIGSPALWNDLAPAELQFDPTTWIPLAKLYAAARELSASFEAGGFGVKIMPLIGLAEDGLSELSDTAFGFLSVDAETTVELAGYTVDQFLQRSLSDELVETLKNHSPKTLFDFAAFRIAKWLDRAVLRPMDVLIDALHLVDRLPFLMDPQKTDATNAADWSQAAAEPAQTLRWEVLEKYKNEKASLVLGRIVFDWFRLSNDDAIDKLQDAYLDLQQDRFHLAEDTSRFVTREKLTRYRADFHNFRDRRAVERLPDITYGPLRRLSFG